ncbi:MAG: phosphoenolpyruvate synthase [Paludibacteraceae bacterium]|nr:phosphoenolpyruvate synthase [Paludibacteraceae bacterium]
MPSINKLYFKDTSFASLMQQRVYNVLLFASKYALFTIEEDGRIDEQIFNEYTSLNLRYPPRFTLVSSEEEAARLLGERHFDLIMTMPSDADTSFDWAKTMKAANPQIPIVLLTPYNRSMQARLEREDLSAIDYIFSWLDNAELLLAIIKLVEDKMNVDEDIRQVGLQTVLLVEDNVRFYSAILPMLYKHLFTQSRAFMTEALNPHEQMLRMRGRPKILLARNYEEASELYCRYHGNMLGVITDAEFPDGMMNDEPSPDWCRRLLREIRAKDPFIPIIVESANKENESLAREANAMFLDKQSQTFLIDLRTQITDMFGFGEFRWRDPKTGKVIMTCENLKELQNNIFKIPDESFLYHVTHNDVSRWLYSRALFPLAEYVKARDPRKLTVADMPEEKRIIYEAILDYRRIKNRGVVAQFRPEVFDQYSNFARMGSGSMGSKGRGLAFVDAMIKRHFELEDIAGTHITIPKTVVLCTDLFSEFMERNGLYPLALSNASDDTILQAFLSAPLPEHLTTNLKALIDVLQGPIAVRSSSLLEDTQYQPFAGIYATYMIPHDQDNAEQTLVWLTAAVKAVYASVFYRESKAYMEATKNVIDEEKMAVVIQEVVGRESQKSKVKGQREGEPRRFYPSFSGVARSLNFYPLGDERTEEGVAEIALGLGKYIVDGGTTLRFSPAHPQHVLQTSTTEMALRQTQTTFLALDLSRTDFHPEVDDGFNLMKCSIADAEQDKRLRLIASTYNFRSGYLYDNILEEGHRVLTFNNILHHNAFPLAEVLQTILEIAQREMGVPVELEFAVNLGALQGEPGTFYLLQIRPIVETKVEVKEDVTQIADNELFVRSPKALGQGVYDDMCEVVYVKPEVFDAALTNDIREEIADINTEMLRRGSHYMLIGPGRWGSSDPWLGIPVRWSDISAAGIIVECAMADYQIEPSQGTHFFQNLTSMGVAYFTVNPQAKMGFVDYEYLNAQQAIHETAHVRVVRFRKPFRALVDGKRGLGVSIKNL